MLKIAFHLFLIFFTLIEPRAFALSIDDLIAHNKRPTGVVIEIVSGDRTLLNTLLPGLNEDIHRLRKKYPDLPIAIVSHGQEQFMLTNNNRSEAEQTHAIVKQLTNNENIDVTIDYFGDSDLAKELYRSPVKGKVKIPRRGSIKVPHQFQYSQAGTNTVTYIIKYDGKELSRWSGKVTVIP